MTKAICASLVFMTAAMLLEPPANAQGIWFGPQIGYQRARDADEGDLLGGAAFRMKFSPSFGAEASIYYREADFEDGAVTIRNWPVHATGQLYLFPGVFAAIGGGWYHTTFDYSEDINQTGIDDDTDTQFGWHFGGGMAVPLGETMQLTGDIRYVFLDYDFQGLPGRDLDSNFYMITIGLQFGRGGPYE